MFCQEYGIEYQGKFDYKIPRAIMGELSYGNIYTRPWKPIQRAAVSDYFVFKTMKLMGLISHRRSADARIARSFRRARKSVLVRNDHNTFCFTERYDINRRQVLQKARTEGRLPSEVNKERSRVFCIKDRRNLVRTAVPDIVLDSLTKIYSRVSYCPNVTMTFPSKENFPREYKMLKTSVESAKRVIKKGTFFKLGDHDLPNSTILNSSDSTFLAEKGKLGSQKAATSEYDVVWDDTQKKYVKHTA